MSCVENQQEAAARFLRRVCSLQMQQPAGRWAEPRGPTHCAQAWPWGQWWGSAGGLGTPACGSGSEVLPPGRCSGHGTMSVGDSPGPPPGSLGAPHSWELPSAGPGLNSKGAACPPNAVPG